MYALPTTGVGVPSDLDALNAQLEQRDPRAILRWGLDALEGALCATSSFQPQSVPLLHMISETVPAMPVLFLDTGFHFPETLAFRDELVERLGLNLVVLTPSMGHAGFLREHGQLYRRDPDLCCHVNKVEPLERALRDYGGWVTGVRRDQTENRRTTPIAAWTKEGKLKINPLATWLEGDVWRYSHDHALPEHPLLAKGYLSVGCAPCTRAVGATEDARAGRWAGSTKTECGLHTGGDALDATVRQTTRSPGDVGSPDNAGERPDPAPRADPRKPDDA